MAWEVSLSNLVLGVYGFTLITGLPANLLAFYTFFQKIRQRSTPIDVLLLSPTISDLVFLFFLPFWMIEAGNMKWTLPYFLCPLSGFVFYSIICNNTLHLTAISVERYLGVAFPIKYKLKRSPRGALVATIIFWIMSMMNCSVVYIVQYRSSLQPNFTNPSKHNKCYHDFSGEQLKILLPVRLELFFVFFLFSFLICCFCYIKCILILSRLSSVNAKKRHRAIRMALGTLLLFATCFMPFNISHVVGFIGGYSPDWRQHALLSSTLNACLDPFVFYFSSSVLRETFKSVLQGLVRRMLLPCWHWARFWVCFNQGKAEEKMQSTDDSFR